MEKYREQKRSNGFEIHVRQCGIALHTQFCFLGASPDCMVCDMSEDKVERRYGLLEVKCPYKAYTEKKTVSMACQDYGNFCCAFIW